jgi:hypothetical protein
MKTPEVLVVPVSTTPDQLAVYAMGGPLPAGSSTITLDELKAMGRPEDCDCGLIQCICYQARQHKEDCPLRLSMTCAIPIECAEHDRDVCPICTPCTCT